MALAQAALSLQEGGGGHSTGEVEVKRFLGVRKVICQGIHSERTVQLPLSGTKSPDESRSSYKERAIPLRAVQTAPAAPTEPLASLPAC